MSEKKADPTAPREFDELEAHMARRKWQFENTDTLSKLASRPDLADMLGFIEGARWARARLAQATQAPAPVKAWRSGSANEFLFREVTQATPPVKVQRWGSDKYCMDKCDDGEWVLWQDIKHLLGEES